MPVCINHNIFLFWLMVTFFIREDTPCEENRTSCGISDDQPLPRSSKLKKGTPKESFPAEEDHSLQPGMSKVVTHVTVDVRNSVVTSIRWQHTSFPVFSRISVFFRI